MAVDIKKLSKDFNNLLEAIKKVKIDGEIPDYNDLIKDNKKEVSEDGETIAGQSMTVNGGQIPNPPLDIVTSQRVYDKSYLNKLKKKKKKDE